LNYVPRDRQIHFNDFSLFEVLYDSEDRTTLKIDLEVDLSVKF